MKHNTVNKFIEATVEPKLIDGDNSVITVNNDQAEFYGVYVKMQVGNDFFPTMHVMDFQLHMKSYAFDLAERLNYLLKVYGTE